MSSKSSPNIEKERQIILDAKGKGAGATLGAYARLSGPGWLQSAITLGGGSLSNALYLGVLVGFSFMWLQPLAMILGVIMLSAIAYVTLSTGEKPLRLINAHVSPILGWGWLAASMMANLVWSMPQFSLGIAAMRQNLLPDVLGPEAMPDTQGKLIAAAVFLAVAVTFVTCYNIGGIGAKIFEILVKVMVGTIVICFFGVVIKMTIEGALNWGAIFAGFIPDLTLLSRPTDGFVPHIEAVTQSCQTFWSTLIVDQQRDVMIGAAATAVGINMTFLLPYSMIRKGWDKDFRGLAIFDLSTGLFIPFLLATGCVVIASASQFHATPAPGFVETVDADGNKIEPPANLVGPYKKLMLERLRFGADLELQEELGEQEHARLVADAKPSPLAKLAFWAKPTPTELSKRIDEKLGLAGLSGEKLDARVDELIGSADVADRTMAAMLVKRDAFNLAKSLAPLTGERIANYMFGIGVIGMAMGATTMLMLINGLCFCEIFNRPARGPLQIAGSLMVCVGVLGPFFWNDAKMWLAVPTSVFAMVLLPIAYFAFFLLMNQKTALGGTMPTGAKRVLWNVLMALAAGIAGLASLWSLWSKLQWIGMALVVGFLTLVLIVQFARKKGDAA
jgi:Mn2+/Fe2+ NRAMP family transporter